MNRRAGLLSAALCCGLLFATSLTAACEAVTVKKVGGERQQADQKVSEASLGVGGRGASAEEKQGKKGRRGVFKRVSHKETEAVSRGSSEIR